MNHTNSRYLYNPQLIIDKYFLFGNDIGLKMNY